MSGWHKRKPQNLRKLVVALSPSMLEKKILDSEERGWKRVGESKPYLKGVAILMEFPNRKGACAG